MLHERGAQLCWEHAPCAQEAKKIFAKDAEIAKGNLILKLDDRRHLPNQEATLRLYYDQRPRVFLGYAPEPSLCKSMERLALSRVATYYDV